MKLQLPSGWISHVSRYSIATKAKIRGHHKGSHRSARFGSSLDFSDFREYHAGDDVRHIDWNVYARTERVYIKRFLDEQEMRVHVLLDSSKSMADKWLFAKQLAFSIGLMVLSHDDRLTMSIGSSAAATFRKKGKSQRKLFEYFIAGLPEPEALSFAKGADFYAAKDSTVLFIISDGLEPLADWPRLFHQAQRYAHDIRILQVSTEAERNPRFDGDLRLHDEETGEPLNVTMGVQTLAAYARKREMHQRGLESLCAKHGVRLEHLHIEEGIQHALFKQLARKKWIE